MRYVSSDFRPRRVSSSFSEMWYCCVCQRELLCPRLNLSQALYFMTARRPAVSSLEAQKFSISNRYKFVLRLKRTKFNASGPDSSRYHVKVSCNCSLSRHRHSANKVSCSSCKKACHGVMVSLMSMHSSYKSILWMFSSYIRPVHMSDWLSKLQLA